MFLRRFCCCDKLDKASEFVVPKESEMQATAADTVASANVDQIAMAVQQDDGEDKALKEEIDAIIADEVAVARDQPIEQPVDPETVLANAASAGINLTIPAEGEAEATPSELPTSQSPAALPDKGIGAPPLPAAASASPNRGGSSGLHLTYNADVGQGTLSSKFSEKALNSLILARSDEIEPSKYNEAAIELARNLKGDWNQQTKSVCGFIRTAANLKSEIEIKSSFFEDLPRKSMLVLHTSNDKLIVLRSPCAFDFQQHAIDAVAVVPLGSDVYRGYSSLNMKNFLDKGVRKGATLRFN